ncbi:MAG: polysaccharide biosynthesis tyrosine autokinase [Planctomycetes bacterium]|nr:polysaccharide biosynthesis tyrosine autokinase [Planctomycetota bacterium]
MDLKDYLRIVRRRFGYFVGFLAFILVMYAGWISWEPEVWSAEAIITVKSLGERLEKVQSLAAGGVAFLSQEVWRQVYWMQRTEQLQFHSAVLLYLVLHRGEEGLGENLDRIREGFKGEFPGNSGVGMLRPVEDLEAALGARVYQALIDEQFQQTKNLFSEARTGALQGGQEDPVIAVKRLRDWIDLHIEINSDEESGLLTVAAKASNKFEAVLAANVVAGAAQWVDFYTKQSDFNRTLLAYDTEYDRTKADIVEARASVMAAVNSRTDVLQRWNLDDLGAARLKAADRRQTLAGLIVDNTRSIETTSADLLRMEEQRDREEESEPTSERVEQSRARKIDLEQQIQGMLDTGFLEGHPDVVRARGQLRVVDREIGDAIQYAVEQRTRNYLDAQQNAAWRLDDLRSQGTRLSQEYEEIKQTDVILTGLETDFHDDLTRIRELTDIQTLLANKRAVLKIARGETLGVMDVSKVAQVEQTNRALKTSTKSWPFVILIALVTSVFVVYLLEYLDTRIKSEHDVRRHVNLPVLAKIPRQPEGEEVLLGEMDLRGKFAEVFNTVATLIHSTARDLGLKTFVITSTKEEEGKTTIAIDLGVALARKGLKVVLVDSDLRRPQMHDLLGLDNSVGLSSILEGRLKAKEVLDDITGAPQRTAIDDFLRPTTEKNLRVLTSGPMPPDPVGVIESVQMQALVEELKGMADYVIFDTPPIYHVGDALTLAPLSDANLLVIGAGLVDHHEVAWAKHLLSNVESNILGVILNFEAEESRTYNYYYNYYTKSYRYR